MAKLIFVNLPVADLAASIACYEATGATRNPQFSNEAAACMVFSETIHVMLLTHDHFRRFTPRPIADARAASEVLVALSADSRAEVDATMARVLAAGGGEPRAAQDHGFMYSRAFDDPDGHIWELGWMDMAAIAAGDHHQIEADAA